MPDPALSPPSPSAQGPEVGLIPGSQTGKLPAALPSALTPLIPAGMKRKVSGAAYYREDP